MKVINSLLRFIVRWENRNTFCLFEPGFVPSMEALTPMSDRGIKLIPVYSLVGNKVQIIRIGSDSKLLPKYKRLEKKYEKS